MPASCNLTTPLNMHISIRYVLKNRNSIQPTQRSVKTSIKMQMQLQIYWVTQMLEQICQTLSLFSWETAMLRALHCLQESGPAVDERHWHLHQSLGWEFLSIDLQPFENLAHWNAAARHGKQINIATWKRVCLSPADFLASTAVSELTKFQ